MRIEKKLIALLGLSSLESIALKTLIHEEGEARIETYGSVENISDNSERFFAFIVSADIFASHPDFFLPRRFKTLVIVDSLPQDKSSRPKGVIYVDDDERELRNIINQLINSEPETTELKGELSQREIEVLKKVAEGKLNKEIADELFISVNTVITHRKNISAKLGVKSASALTTFALMNGII